MTDLNAMKPFWMVYGIGQREPTKRHETAAAADHEAERLARSNPGKTFVVLEATNAIRLREFDRRDLRNPRRLGATAFGGDPEDDIPF